VTVRVHPPHRVYGSVRDDDLNRLVEIERRWRARAAKEHWRLYADRLLCVCLAQGAALHLIDRENRIKDSTSTASSPRIRTGRSPTRRSTVARRTLTLARRGSAGSRTPRASRGFRTAGDGMAPGFRRTAVEAPELLRAILEADRSPQPGDRCKMSVLNPLKSRG
jgi:hypothetical protein